MKTLFVGIALFLSISSYSQTYKIDLTEWVMIIKDPINGGIGAITDARKSSSVLTFDVNNGLATITDAGKESMRFKVSNTLTTSQIKGQIFYNLDCYMTTTQDSRAEQVKVKIYLCDTDPLAQVFICDSQYTILAFKGSAASVKMN